MSLPMRILAHRDGSQTEVRVLMAHPMETGLRRHPQGYFISAHFIRRITATCKGRMVMSVRCNLAISQNPFLLFRFDGGEVGDVIEVSWTDSREQSRTDSAPIAAAPSGA